MVSFKQNGKAIKWFIFLLALALTLVVGILSRFTDFRTVWEKLALSRSVNRQPFGVFHLVWFLACFLLAVIAGAFAFRFSEEKRESITDSIVFFCGIAFLLLEVFKQDLWYFGISAGEYPFSVFPAQFCSLPIYLCPLAFLLPKKARQVCYRFLALYGTVGGALVIGYPNIPKLTILAIHSMLWHTIMIVLGVYLLLATETGHSFIKEWGPATALFICFFAIATILNIALRKTDINLFYMSPYHTTYFWVIKDVQIRFGWLASVLLYLVLFAFVAFFPMWTIARIVYILKRKNLQ